MKIGSLVAKNPNLKFNLEIDYAADCGFDCIDYNEFTDNNSFIYQLNDEDFKDYLLDLKNELRKHNIYINQLHSLWVNDMFKLDQEDVLFNSTINYYIRSIQGASILDCKYVVIHHRIPLIWDKLIANNEYCRDINIKFLKALIPYAKKYNVVLCLENLPFIFPYTQFEDTIKQVEEINSEYVGMCLDTGHFNMFNNGYTIREAVKRMSKYFKVMHCHDNYGNQDSHLFPKQGTFDWIEYGKILKEVGFDGVFSYENCSQLEKYDERIKEEKAKIEFAKRILNITST